MINTKISIIIPTYNYGGYIEETIKSIIYQKGAFDLECIVVDGLSTDNTLEIIRKYQRLIQSNNFKPRCRSLNFMWVSEKDRGQSHAINKGLRLSSGEIVNWINADDTLTMGALGIVSNIFSKNSETNVVFGNSGKINEGDDKVDILYGRSFSRDELIRRWDSVYVDFFIPQSSCFLRRSLFDKYGYLDEDNQFSMDYEFYLRVNKDNVFYYVDRVLSIDKVHPRSKSIQYQKEQYRESIGVSKKYWRENYFLYAPSYVLNSLLKLSYRTSYMVKVGLRSLGAKK